GRVYNSVVLPALFLIDPPPADADPLCGAIRCCDLLLPVSVEGAEIIDCGEDRHLGARVCWALFKTDNPGLPPDLHHRVLRIHLVKIGITGSASAVDIQARGDGVQLVIVHSDRDAPHGTALLDLRLVGW